MKRCRFKMVVPSKPLLNTVMKVTVTDPSCGFSFLTDHLTAHQQSHTVNTVFERNIIYKYIFKQRKQTRFV